MRQSVVSRAALLLALALSATAQAAPLSVEECVASSTLAQEFQKKGSLSAAKHHLQRCADRSCPGVVQAECTRWLDEVLAAMPTITIAVRLDGVDQPKARVFLDGRPWIEELTGHPVEIDPGEHLLTVYAGARQQEQRLLINLAEKNRLVVFSLRTPDAVAVTPLPVPPPVEPPPEATKPVGGRPFPVVATALSATAVVGLGVFTGLGLWGRASLSQLEADPCAVSKTCAPSRVSAIQGAFIAADVGLGVGVVAALAAAWQWWRWAREPLVVPAVSLLPGGAAVTLSGAW